MEANGVNASGSWISLHNAAIYGDLGKIKSLVGADFHARTNRGFKAIHLAVLNNHKSIVDYFLRRGMSIDEFTDQYWTPLHISVMKGNFEMIEFLVANGAHKRVKTIKGLSPLHIASKFGHVDVVKFFLAKGLNFNECCFKGWTPLSYAAFSGSVTIIKLLLEIGAKCESSNYVSNPLYIAIFEGHLKAVKTLELAFDLNLFRSNINSLLCNAVERGCFDIVKYLFENGASNVLNSKGVKPIHIAASNGFEYIVEYFLNEGVCIDDADEDEWTPLHYAIRNRHYHLVKYLINRGANIKARSRHGASALCITSLYRQATDILHFCFKNKSITEDNILKHQELTLSNHSKIIDFLIENDAPVNDACNDGWMPLHFAFYKTFRNKVDYIARKLIDAGALLDAQNKNGRTPLHIAAKVYNVQALKVLINAGSNLNIRDENGDTPLHIACKNRKIENMAALLDAGAKSDVKDIHGRTVLFYCLRNFMNFKSDTLEQNRRYTHILEKVTAFTDIDDKEKMSAVHLAVKSHCSFRFLYFIVCLQNDLNVVDINGNTPLNLVTDKLSMLPAPICIATIKLLVDSGAYFKVKDCERLVAKNHLRDMIFNDVNLCAKSILNRLNNDYFPKLYNSYLSVNLPPIDKLKLNIIKSMNVKENVEKEIVDKGFCDISKIMPTLGMFSIICLTENCNKSEQLISP